jgi:hypothetical protein
MLNIQEKNVQISVNTIFVSICCIVKFYIKKSVKLLFNRYTTFPHVLMTGRTLGSIIPKMITLEGAQVCSIR